MDDDTRQKGLLGEMADGGRAAASAISGWQAWFNHNWSSKPALSGSSPRLDRRLPSGRLAAILGDAHDWRSQLEVVPFDFELSLN